MVLATSAPAWGQQRPTAAIALAPAIGPPTSRVTVDGSDFAAAARVVVTFDGVPVGHATTDGSGSFRTKIRVPKDAAPASHVVRARDSAAHVAGAPFVVNTNWSMFRFNLHGSGSNRFENVIDPSNVPSLELKWARFLPAWVNGLIEDGGVVYAASGFRGGEVAAFNAATGFPLWQFAPGANFFVAPASANGVVYVANNEFRGEGDELSALNESDGTPLWSVPKNASSSPMVSEGVLYVGSNDRSLDAVSTSDGSILWSFPTGNQYPTTPALAYGRLFAIAGQVDALDPMTGSLLWSFPAAGTSSPAVVDGVVYVGSSDDNVYALNASTGDELWRFTTDGDVQSSPAVADGMVYVGSNDGTVYALNASTGSEVWRYATGAMVHSSPVVANGVVYVGSMNGSVYAFDASTGARLWSFQEADSIYSSPIVANGMLYVGADDGSLTAFGLP